MVECPQCEPEAQATASRVHAHILDAWRRTSRLTNQIKSRTKDGILLAQTIEPLGGWGGLVLQFGAFGLLTYIVTILLPAHDRTVSEERKGWQEERWNRDKMFMSALAGLSDTISKAIDKQTDGINRHIDASIEVCKRAK